MLRPEDLEESCPACGGRGRVYKRECVVWEYDTITTPGESSMLNNDQVCPICQGMGTVPTEQGQVLLEFIMKYLSE